MYIGPYAMSSSSSQKNDNPHGGCGGKACFVWLVYGMVAQSRRTFAGEGLLNLPRISRDFGGMRCKPHPPLSPLSLILSYHTFFRSQRGHFRPFSAISGHGRTSPDIAGHFRTSPAISGHRRPFPDVTGHFRTSAAISRHRPFPLRHTPSDGA